MVEGISEYFNCYSPNIIQMGTLRKAFGAIRNFVAGDRGVADVIRLTSSAYGFTCPPPPDQASALIAALDLLAEEPQRRQKLWGNQLYFGKRMRPFGYQLLAIDTAIIPVLIGDAGLCIRHAQALRDEGIHIDAVQFPAVPLARLHPFTRHNKANL